MILNKQKVINTIIKRSLVYFIHSNSGSAYFMFGNDYNISKIVLDIRHVFNQLTTVTLK